MQKAACLFVIFLLTCLVSCNLFKKKNSEVRTFSTDMESMSFSSYWKKTESIIEGTDAHSGKHFSRTSKQHPLGFSYESELPGFIKTKNFALELEFYYRMQSIESNATLTITVSLGDSLIYREKQLVSSDSAINKWALYKSRTKFPGNLPPEAMLSVTLQNNGKAFFDVDDYSISFNRIGRPSFLVSEVKKEEKSFFSGFSFRPIYKNNFYIISYSDKLGDFQIRSGKNDKIFSSVRYYIQWLKGNDTLSAFADKLFFLPTEKNELRITGETKISHFTMKLFVSDNSPLIKVETKTIFKDSLKLIRESLCIDYSPDESEIYRKNTLLDKKRIRNEYWLDKEGVKIGSKAKTLYFYHNPDISSIQLSSKVNEININLDYYKDHPLSKALSSSHPAQNLSFNRYKIGANHENIFQFYAGFDAGSLPRLMKSPNGYQASYVIINEEDNIDMQTKLTHGIGSTVQYIKNEYFNFSKSDSDYNFNGHLIFPYPGFGDFFPTPNYWTNATIEPDVYSWKPNQFLSHENKWNSIFTAQRVRDFVDNRGIVFSYCKPEGYNTSKDSLVLMVESDKIQKKVKSYKNQKLIYFTTVSEIMNYWLGLEKIEIQILGKGMFKIQNNSYQNIRGLSLAINADSVFINNKIPDHYYLDTHDDLIVWIDLPAQKSVIIEAKKNEE